MKQWRGYLQRLSAVLIMMGGGIQAVSAAPVMPQGYGPRVVPQQATPGVLQFRPVPDRAQMPYGMPRFQSAPNRAQAPYGMPRFQSAPNRAQVPYGMPRFQPAPNRAQMPYGMPAHSAVPYGQPWMGQRPQVNRPMSRGHWPIPSNYMRRPAAPAYGNWQRPVARYPGNVNPYQPPVGQWHRPSSVPQYYGNRAPAFPRFQPMAPANMQRPMAPNNYYSGPRNHRPYPSAPRPYAQSAQRRVKPQPALAGHPYRFRPTRDMVRYQPRWPQANRAQHQFRPLARPQSRPQPQFRQWAQVPHGNRAGHGSPARQLPSYQRPTREHRMSARPVYRPTMSKPHHSRMAVNPRRPMHKPIHRPMNPVHQHQPKPFRGQGTGYRQDVKIDYRSRGYKPYRRHAGIQSPYAWRPRSRSISPYGQQFAYGASPLQ